MGISLTGVPQSGKSTLPSALTRGRTVPAAHGTGRQEAHTGVERIPDPRLETLPPCSPHSHLPRLKELSS